MLGKGILLGIASVQFLRDVPVFLSKLCLFRTKIDTILIGIRVK